MLRADVVVLGAGVVGLACARALAACGREVYLVEPEAGVGRGTSSRNSGVIHAGLYYPRDSWKARLCVAGARQLYAYCETAGVPYERSGKWVLATAASELSALESLATSARLNGAVVEWTSGAELARQEPALCAHAALWSPGSGIVSVPDLLEALLRDARDDGAELVLGQGAVGVRRVADGWELALRAADGSPRDDERVHARAVVNAAGHAAPVIARLAGVDLDALCATPRFYRGDYLSVSPSAPRPRCALVYPLPQQHGLGVHLTRDLGGSVRAGPDAYAVSEPDTRLSLLSPEQWEHKADAFAASLRRFLPGIEAQHLQPEFAGVRPKLVRADGSSDFLLLGPADAGAGCVHLLGVESPGLTACLAIAEWVATRLETRTTRS